MIKKRQNSGFELSKFEELVQSMFKTSRAAAEAEEEPKVIFTICESHGYSWSDPIMACPVCAKESPPLSKEI